MFEAAMMSRADVRRYNKTAHQAGKHLCPGCLWEFDWTEENFYVSARRAGKIELHHDCKACCNAAAAARLREKYQTDEAYRLDVLARTRARTASLSENARALKAERARVYRKQYKRKRRKAPFDVTTIHTIDLHALSYRDVLWINRSLREIGCRVCTVCREVKPLTRANFKACGQYAGKIKRLSRCQVCEAGKG